jgi:hypothetical protein
MHQKIVMQKNDLLREHKHLIRVLKYGSHAQQVKEANSQAKEMRKYK